MTILIITIVVAWIIFSALLVTTICMNSARLSRMDEPFKDPAYSPGKGEIMITEPMIEQKQTEAENELDQRDPFYRMGFALGELNIALLKMGQAYDQGWVDSLELHRQLEKLSRRQRLAIWVLDTAEQLANWIEGSENE